MVSTKYIVEGGEEIPAGGWRGGEEIPAGGWRAVWSRRISERGISTATYILKKI